MIYDYQGNVIETEPQGTDNLIGYVMQSEPTWTTGYCIRADQIRNNSGVIGALETFDANVKASDFIPVRGKNSLIIPLPVVSNATPTYAGLCFYDENQQCLTRYSTNFYFGRGSGDPYVKNVEVFVPEEAAYFRTTYWSDSYIASHSGIPSFTYEFTPGLYRASAITHEIPTNRGMLNAVRLARQLTDIEWTPLVDIPRYCLLDADYSGQADFHFLDWCKSGKTYKGIPYSGGGGPDRLMTSIDANTYAGQWGYVRMVVGIDISFETFVTAARYENSIMGRKQGQTQPDFDSSPYGTFCSGLCWHAFGKNSQPIPSAPSILGAANFITVAQSVATMDVNLIRLCDIVQNDSHVAIITDIMRDRDGNITNIEVSEATTVGNANNSVAEGDFGGLCRRKFWTVDEFKSWYRQYGMYRFLEFTDIQYQKSDFVDTGDEPGFTKLVDMPCIPFLGNKAVYHVGYIVNSKILIGATGFTDLVVMKDGTQFGQFSINGATEIEVGFSAAGSYSAYLKKGSVRTKSCEWTVV